MFYPSDPRVLAAQVHALLSQADLQGDIPLPKALVVPHAGYVYSGPIAASAYRLLEPLREKVRRVVIFGPSHRVAFSGMALPACAAFATPLGSVEVDLDSANAIARLPGVSFDDRPHAQEHSLEVQLPFLQDMLDHFRVLPIVLGMVPDQQVADVMNALWGGDETLIVVSSDLSHYNPYLRAQEADRATIDLMLDLQPLLRPDQACGCTAVNALLLAARRHHLAPHLLDLRNSGDTAGDRSRVVGYAAMSFAPQAQTAH